MSMQSLGQMVEICMKARMIAAQALMTFKQCGDPSEGIDAMRDALVKIDSLLEKVNNA